MEFSEDIAYNVLSWLSAKAIYKFKSVSKSFSKISEESTFLTKQAENSLAKDDTCIFIQHSYMGITSSRRRRRRRPPRIVVVVELHPLPRNQPSSGISNDFLKSRLNYTGRVLSSSNGLVLCTTNDYPTKLFICNPVTKSRSSIPNPINYHSDTYNVHGDDLIILLECHQGVDDYSLFHFERQTVMSLPWYRCNVYKAKEGVWKTMKGGFFMGGGGGGGDLTFDYDYMPVYLNGLFYIVSDGYLMTYSLENGEEKMLRLPEQVDFDNRRSVRIFKWGKASSSTRSICLVNFAKPFFTVWFLKDYESDLWQKVFKVRVKAMGVKEKHPKVTSYMVMNGDLLIFATEKKVYSYGLAGERYMMFEEICEHSCGSSIPCFVSYTDTLRPC